MRWGIAGGNVQKDVHFCRQSTPPVFLPVRATRKAPRARPVSIALTIFGLVPLVERATTMSCGADKRFHLGGRKIRSKTVVVARGGEHRSVGGEGLAPARPGRSVLRRTTSFRGQVLGVGGAASIAEEDELAAVANGGGGAHCKTQRCGATSASEKRLLDARALSPQLAPYFFDVARP